MSVGKDGQTVLRGERILQYYNSKSYTEEGICFYNLYSQFYFFF